MSKKLMSEVVKSNFIPVVEKKLLQIICLNFKIYFLIFLNGMLNGNMECWKIPLTEC